MTREQISQYIVEARNPDGTLVFPEWGGCWHVHPRGGPSVLCIKCDSNNATNPDLHTWPSFGILWPRMQAREDYQRFVERYGCVYYPERPSHGKTGMNFMLPDSLINPATLPAIIYAWLTREDV